MKRVLVPALVAVLVLSACSTVSSRIPGVNISSPISVKPAAALAGAVDLRDGEVLCAAGTDVYKEDFYAARIVTPASAASKNQAEAVFLHNGKKEWVNFIIPSRKAAKQDLAIGKVVFVPHYYQERKELDVDDYRKTVWVLGRVTSIDEMFKDLVEVGGHKYYWNLVRVPDKEP
jgi:hypothetical protein